MDLKTKKPITICSGALLCFKASLGITLYAGKMIFQCCKLYFYTVSTGPLFPSREASVSGNVAATWMRKWILTLPSAYWNIRRRAPLSPRFHWMCFTAGLHKRPSLLSIITNQLNKRPIKTMAPEYNLPPNFHLPSAFFNFFFNCVGQTCVLKAQH